MNAAGTAVTSFRGQIRLQAIPDGTSNTFAIGEKHVRFKTEFGTNEDRSVYDATNANNYRRFAGLASDDAAQVLQLYSPEPIWNIQAVSNRSFGSRHTGVCQFVFCDGSVRALQNSTPLDILTRLADRQDGLPIPGDF
jgi:prepilin-type processing-associated H-X9-DG protein